MSKDRCLKGISFPGLGLKRGDLERTEYESTAFQWNEYKREIRTRLKGELF